MSEVEGQLMSEVEGQLMSEENGRADGMSREKNEPDSEDASMNFVQVEMYLFGRLIGAKISYSDMEPYTYFEVLVDNVLANIRKEALKVIKARFDGTLPAPKGLSK